MRLFEDFQALWTFWSPSNSNIKRKIIKEILSKKLNNEMYQAIYSFSSRSTLPLVVRESISTASLIGTIKECIWLIFTVMQFMLQILLLLERFSGVKITSKDFSNCFPISSQFWKAQFKSFKFRVHQNDELIFGLSKHSLLKHLLALKLAKLLCFWS